MTVQIRIIGTTKQSWRLSYHTTGHHPLLHGSSIRSKSVSLIRCCAGCANLFFPPRPIHRTTITNTSSEQASNSTFSRAPWNTRSRSSARSAKVLKFRHHKLLNPLLYLVTSHAPVTTTRRTLRSHAHNRKCPVRPGSLIRLLTKYWLRRPRRTTWVPVDRRSDGRSRRRLATGSSGCKR